MDHKQELIVITVVSVVSLIGLFFLFSNSITGYSAKSLNVKYLSCQYLDHDNSGDCMRVERQEGVKCHPNEDITIDYQRASPMRLFLRLCKPISDTERF